MKSLLKVLVLLFVPIFGLNSCSKDRPVDSWQMTEPSVVGTGQEPLAVSAASRRVLMADSALKFAPNDWAHMTVTSRCTYEGKAFENTADFEYQPSIELKSLWPSSLWKTLPNAELIKSECDFSFAAKNQVGSTQSFDLTRIKLTNFINPNFAAKLSAFSATNGATVKSSALNEVVKTLAEHISDQGQITLVCGQTTSSMSVLAAARSQDLVQSLMTGAGLRGRQLCHYVVAELALASQPPRFEISQDISTKFPSVALKTAFRFPVSAATLHVGAGPALSVFHATIANSSETQSYVRVLSPNAIGYRAVYIGPGPMGLSGADPHQFIESAKTMHAPLVTSVDGVAAVGGDENSKIYAIAPGATAEIDIRFAGYNRMMACLDASALGGREGSGFKGFKFGFETELQIQQDDTPEFREPQTLFQSPGEAGEYLPSSLVLDTYRVEIGPEFARGRGAEFPNSGNMCLYGALN